MVLSATVETSEALKIDRISRPIVRTFKFVSLCAQYHLSTFISTLNMMEFCQDNYFP